MVFLLTDSCISEKNGEVIDNQSSFGEKFDIYNNYSVSESEIKIVTMDNIIISYSGNIEKAKEAIENFTNSIKYFYVEDALNIMQSNYSTKEFELIIICKKIKNEIYYFNGEEYSKIEDYIEIGSGKEDKKFCDKINKFINQEQRDVEINKNGYYYRKSNFDKDKHLVNVITYVQFLSKEKNMFIDGVGGLFGGLYLDTEINWCKDLLYYIYEGNSNEYKTISVVSRFNSIFSYSDYSKVIRYYGSTINNNKKIINDLYFQKNITKCLMEGLPDFIVIYDEKSKMIANLKVDKWPHTDLFKMWIRRKENETKYAFLISSIFNNVKKIIIGSNESELELYNMVAERINFEPREECVGATASNIQDVEDFDIEYDYDLRCLELKSGYLGDSHKLIDIDIEKYNNLVIIDYSFLYEIVNETYIKYKFAEVKLENLRLDILIKKYFSNISSRNFYGYRFYFVKSNSDNDYIDKFSLAAWIEEYDNCTLLEVNKENYENEFSLIVLETLKKYYNDEKYFFIDKLILFCDNKYINEILQFAPKINMESENPDIFLIRNINGLTNMDGRFRYVVADYAISAMLGYTATEISLLESGYNPREYEG